MTTDAPTPELQSQLAEALEEIKRLPREEVARLMAELVVIMQMTDDAASRKSLASLADRLDALSGR